MLELWQMLSPHFIAIDPRSTLAHSCSAWFGLIYGSNRTKLCTDGKLNCLLWNCFWHWNWVFKLNWNVWNGSVYMYKKGFRIKNQQWLIFYKAKPNRTIFHISIFFPCFVPSLIFIHGGAHVILRTGAVIELRRSQSWRTSEHINCHQSLGT